MSSKYKRPAEAEPIEPEKLKVRRGELINFMNFMSMDENFCLRVWNTVQGVHERALKEAEAARPVVEPQDQIVEDPYGEFPPVLIRAGT